MIRETSHECSTRYVTLEAVDYPEISGIECRIIPKCSMK